MAVSDKYPCHSSFLRSSGAHVRAGCDCKASVCPPRTRAPVLVSVSRACMCVHERVLKSCTNKIHIYFKFVDYHFKLIFPL